MIEKIYYLVRNPLSQNGFIFPSELEENYYAYGGFYILENKSKQISNTYSFHAVSGNVIIETKLEKVKNSNNYFRVSLDDVGNVLFYAQPMNNRYRYDGKYIELQEKKILYCLKCFQKNILDEICQKNNFYFVGYSDTIK